MPRIVESPRPRKLKDPKIVGGFKDEQHTDAVRLCIHLHAHILGLPAGLQRGKCAIHLVT